MPYEALYRKWRPKVFEDIIGQEETVTILKNQIKYSNIAHAYLFTGIRGTGKTSTARIFARAVNCINPENANPCNNCEICKGILAESIIDVIEIDAASNRGIDNIRELREHTKYNPSKGKYKIYIIDEVHMLTDPAFNALLKTLEEPPAHVIFILATTEPNKVPATILSRCQRFDFKPVKTKDIIEQLSLVCKDMSINYEDEALRLIALNSEGALRDALSILDRCVSFNNETLKYDDVINILGAVNYEFIFNLVENIAGQNTSDVLTLINEIFMEGKDAGQLIRDLISHFRNLLLVKMDVKTDELLTLPEERLKQFKEQSRLFNVNQISSFIYTLSDIESKLKYSSQPKILMEIAVVSLCNKELNDSLEGIIERVKHLEKIIASGEIKVSKDYEKVTHHKSDEIKTIKPLSDSKKQEKTKSTEAEHPREGVEDIKKDIKEEKQHEGEKQHEEEKQDDKDGVLDFGAIKNAWERVLNQMKRDEKAQIGALLKEGTLEELKEDVLTISLKKGFEIHRNRLDKKDTKEYISNVIKKFTGQDIRLSFVMEDELAVSDNADKQKDPVQKLKEILPGEIFDKVEVIDE